MPSIFSRIVAGELPAFKVAEDAAHLAFLDITPLVEGHVLVIPKREVDYIFDLPASELAALHVFAQRVARGLKAAVPCRRVGVAVIGLEVPHAHIHLIPMEHVADMSFANPKIKVPETRMRELAAAIAAAVPGGAGLTGSASSTGLTGSADKQPPTPADNAPNPADELFAQLRGLSSGLFFISESDAPLEAVRFAAPAGALSESAVRKLLAPPAKTPVETVELTHFLRNHTADDGVLGDAGLSNRYKALQFFLKQELTDTRVFRVGSSPQVTALALGRAGSGELLGFKAVLTET